MGLNKKVTKSGNNVLYSIRSRETREDEVVYHVSLNKDSFIYQAHFPGDPITPGGCMVQTALELLEDMTGTQLEISEAKNIKFLHILSPTACPEADFVFTSVVSGESVKAKVNVMKADAIFARLSLTVQAV